MQLLQSDIVSLEAYFQGLVDEDQDIKTLVLETSHDPFQMERFNSVSNSGDFNYPAIAMMMPVITGEDNGMHDFEAKQEIGFAILYPTDGTHADELEKYRQAQLTGWRFIQRIRRDSKKRIFRLDKVFYKMAPYEYGSDKCVGQYILLQMITSTNSQIGS